MNSEHMNTTRRDPIPDEAWEVFLSDGDDEPQPEEGDFWFDAVDVDDFE